MGMLDGLKVFSGLQSLVGMGVATIRMVAAVLTVLGVWIHLDTLNYLSQQSRTDPRDYAKDGYVPRENRRPALLQTQNIANFVPTTVPEAIVPDVVESYQDDLPVEQGQSDGPIHRTDPNRFFIPFLSMGPNNQLEGFLESVFLAIKLNRTMCIPPFFRHKTDEALSSSISADLRINRKKLSEFVTFCDTEQIQEKCPKLDTVWWGSNPKTLTCGISLQKRYKTFQMLTGLENWYSTTVCKVFEDIPTYPADLTGKFQVRSTAAVDLVETFNDQNSGACVLWFMPFHTISNFRSAVMSHLLHKNDGGDRQLAMDIVKYVQRPEAFQNVVKKFIAEKAAGKPLISVHWRYDQRDWLLHCDRLPDGQADKSCRNVAQMLENPELAADNFRIFLRGVRNALKQDMIVYIAAPMDEQIMRSKLIDAIKEVGLTSLSSVDLLPYLEETGIRKSDIHDVLSTSEQELCFQSDVFLYSQISTWSFNLVYQRRVNNKNSIDNFYVFGGQAVAAATHQAVENFKRTDHVIAN
ncbi:Oidioi.mRNA.OKI2018_I69.PAR.g9150.t1.cds [Oikopleura dioica]|uniref:GDP-fucose protein O-fucosyltransferase 2 n=1 Tax=Oikopleura dioica TaxID=34765 RepID=A0ABN7RPN9_OIKDI|nr:Oidioi.mRNA.OKI2018_I69.PAR.g9150.t1.cds [Oikopleura dioica]